MFRANLKLEEDVAQITCLGNAAEIEPGIIPEVRRALDSNVRTILMNMSGVQFIDAEGVQTIADTIQYAQKRDGKVFLTDMQPQVSRMVFMNQPGKMLPQFNTKRDAMREIGFQRLKEYIVPRENLLLIEGANPVAHDLATIFREKKLWYSYKLKTTRVGRDAHELVKEFNPSVILLDSTVSTNDGVTFISWMKSDYIFWYIPILVVTAEGMVRKALHFVQNGADDLIFYPFRKEELNPRLQFAIQMKNIVQREKERQAQEEEEARI